jgi:hypothetical protein
MKRAILTVLVLLALAVPAMAQEHPSGIVGIGVDKGTADNILGWLKTLAIGGGSATGFAFLQKLLKDRKPQPGPTPQPSPVDPGKFDPSKLIDRLKDLLDGNTPQPSPSPSPLPFPVPTDLQRFLDFVMQTKALHDDIKTKGQPVGSKHEFLFADGSARTVELGTKSVPAPVAQ